MRISFCSVVLISLISLMASCGIETTKEETESKTLVTKTGESNLFLNIELKELQEGLKKHFEDVSSESFQGKTKPGEAGHMEMNGRRFQRFQLGGKISEEARADLLKAAKGKLLETIHAKGATQVGEVVEDIKERPMAILLYLTPPGGLLSPFYLQGFSIAYKDGSGEGFIDVVFSRLEKDGKETGWSLGLVIHELAPAK